MLTLHQFDYPFDASLIAHQPLEQRDQSRLLVLNRDNGHISHRHFFELPTLLRPTDVIVRNNTQVIPGRIYGHKQPNGSAVEFLLVKRLAIGRDNHEVWECMTKPGLKVGQVVIFPGNDASALTAQCVAETGYTRSIQFNQAHDQLLATLVNIGHMPVPPYIEWADSDEQLLRQRYQTTYAKVAGSAAAPTAGFHFTPELDKMLQAKGIQIEEITLHVGLGTFLSVKTEDITQHLMHSESFVLSPAVAERLNQAKQDRRRIIAVGTTSTRVLESCATENEALVAQSGETTLFAYPPYQFKFVDGMITNFHLPKTTLLMLIAAFVSSPNTAHQFTDFVSSPVGQAYLEAMKLQYRFYSFGDSMMIV